MNGSLMIVGFILACAENSCSVLSRRKKIFFRNDDVMSADKTYGVNVQYYAPPSPELSSTTEQTASKRRKKRKRRRRTGETEEESESSVDDNCNRSISSTECSLDYPAQLPLEYDDETLAPGRLSSHHHQNAYAAHAEASALLYSSLPHGIVDAPEFVPAEYSALCHQPAATDAAAAPSSSSQNSRDNSPAAPDYVPKSSAPAGLNVYCKPFDGGRGAKRDCGRVSSSSNNSDSGISSPGSEDTSKREFRPKEVKSGAGAAATNGCTGAAANGAVDSKLKKPRSRRSNKASSKVVEETTTAPKVRQGGQATQRSAAPKSAPVAKPARRGDAKKEARNGSLAQEPQSKKAESTVTRVGRRVKSSAVICATAKTKASRKEAKEVDVDEPSIAVEIAEPLAAAPVVSPPETECAEAVSGAEDELVNERLAAPPVTDRPVDELRCDGCSAACARSSGGVGACIRDIEDDCEVPPLDCDTQPQAATRSADDTVSSSSAPDTDSASTMLNEYVQIEEQPVLAKLIDLTELADDKEGALDELHISEFASCRENAAPSTEASAAPIAPTPPPRRRKPNRKCVESAAAELVDEVIAHAQQRVRRSAQTSACDNEFQLPVTQAVTKWLHEHGGLPAVRELAGADQRHALSDEDESSDEEEAAQLRPKNVDEVKMAVTVSRAKTQKKLKQNCVIC